VSITGAVSGVAAAYCLGRHDAHVPVRALRAAAQRIVAGDDTASVPETHPDPEVAALARSLEDLRLRLVGDRRRLRDVAARAFRAQETERARLAHELQEETAQTLSMLLLRLGVARGLTHTQSREAALEEVRALLADTVDGVRQFARRLVPPALNDAGLGPALQSYVASLAESSGVAIRLTAGDVRGLLAREGELALFRVVQEALANAVRHADASRIQVEISRHEGWIRAVVADDGRGFDPADRESDHPCLGLLGMRERALYASGRTSVASVPGAGTRVTVELPVTGAGHTAPWPSIVPRAVAAGE
jgi:signal transduction histidine kinase